MSKESYYRAKRGQQREGSKENVFSRYRMCSLRQQREGSKVRAATYPTINIVSKETYYSVKRDLL